ncbi:hypothetical protein [Achromobacter marplatensis]|uniref:hypothetical protein n=1 Tax=Achromobacter marplatensis TaxID=470868 RepID=UPI000277F490|nr:hypothetical protein [Achromobacter marplatensis]EJO27582.1 hypothetical protein QWC_31076 [Achromobacter marplatensis]
MDEIEDSGQLTLLDSAVPDGRGTEDSNHGIEEGAVATHHESAQTMAHDGSASGVSAQPSPTIAELLMMGPDERTPMPSFEATKAFLREYYLHSRFEGRDGPAWWPDYSDTVTRGTLEHLSKYAITCVSMYDCNRGRAVWFGRTLTVLNPDDAPAQIQKQPGNLTHIYGQSL